MAPFDIVISRHFYEIRENFRVGLKRRGLGFDEDIFSDSCLKCLETLKDKELTDQEAVKYLWVAYVNKLKTPERMKFESIPDTITEEIDVIDEGYDHSIDELYSIIINSLKGKFEEDLVEAWKLHFAQGLSYKELREMGYDYNFNPEFKKISRFIKNKLVPENHTVKELSKKYH